MHKNINYLWPRDTKSGPETAILIHCGHSGYKVTPTPVCRNLLCIAVMQPILSGASRPARHDVAQTVWITILFCLIVFYHAMTVCLETLR